MNLDPDYCQLLRGTQNRLKLRSETNRQEVNNREASGALESVIVVLDETPTA